MPGEENPFNQDYQPYERHVRYLDTQDLALEHPSGSYASLQDLSDEEDVQHLYETRPEYNIHRDDVGLRDEAPKPVHQAPYPDEFDDNGSVYSDEIGGQEMEFDPATRFESESDFQVRPISVDYSSETATEDEEGKQNKEWVKRNASGFKRYGTRKINLVENQIFQSEYLVPSAVQEAVLPKYRDEESGSTEFSHMRYTAATCDPDDFPRTRGYNLRAAEYGRNIELLITVTYYNEDKQLTARTLYGVMQNIRDICNLKRTGFWNNESEAWKKILVVIVMDGIEPCDKNTLDMLATMGLYQDGIMKKNVNGEDTVAHIFEYTTQICVTPDQKLVRPSPDHQSSLPPIQMVLCLKQENSKKINSHRWVFNAFCPILKPEVVCLLDAGTRPGKKSLLYLWQAFYNNRNIGGACGEIHAMLGKYQRNVLNPLVATQNFEYKISNILDKPLESMFGFISVLPGAFSAYRYSALEGRPLEQYFHGDHTLAKRLGKKGIDGMSIFRKNMFLAEDRILCFEVCFKRKCKWHLAYVKASKAETDVPDGISELISQRRRWLNGSFAAGIYSMLHFSRVYSSGHNPLRMLLLHIQFLYNVLQQILSWFNLASYYLTITVIVEMCANPKSFGAPDNSSSFPFPNAVSAIISIIVKYVYLLFVAISFILALGNRPKGSKWMYYMLVTIFAVIQVYALIISFQLTYRAFEHQNMKDVFKDLFSDFVSNTALLVIVALASTFGLFIVSAIIYLDPWHIFTSFIQYMLFMPSFVNVLNVYAFCNWHDVSWGTKGSDTVEKLPEAKAIKVGEVAVVEDVEKSQADVNDEFRKVVQRALTPYAPPKEKDKMSPDDETKMFRTYLVVLWIVSNVVLVWAVTTTDNMEVAISDSSRRRITGFFEALLWSNAVIAAIRLIGCITFVSKSFFLRIFARK